MVKQFASSEDRKDNPWFPDPSKVNPREPDAGEKTAPRPSPCHLQFSRGKGDISSSQHGHLQNLCLLLFQQ